MKKRLFRLVFYVSVLLMTACATGPAFTPSVLPALQSGQARIVLMRGHTVQGVGTYPQVRVNGDVIGNIVLGSYAAVNVPLGATQVQLEPGSFTWSAAYGVNKYTYQVQDAQTIYLRLQMATGTSGVVIGGRAMPAYGFDFREVSEKTAMALLPSLRNMRNERETRETSK